MKNYSSDILFLTLSQLDDSVVNKGPHKVLYFIGMGVSYIALTEEARKTAGKPIGAAFIV